MHIIEIKLERSYEIIGYIITFGLSALAFQTPSARRVWGVNHYTLNAILLIAIDLFITGGRLIILSDEYVN